MYTLKNTENESNRLSHQTQLYGGPAFVEPFLKDGLRVLDVGCGTGIITHYFSKKFSASQFVGCDLDLGRLDSSVVKNKLKNLEFITGTIFKLPFPDHSFDLAYCRFILFHLTDPVNAIRELVRVVKPGGKVVACEGMHDAIWIRPRRPVFEKGLQEWIRGMQSLGQDPFLGSDLRRIFHDAGLRSIQMQVNPESHGADDPLLAIYFQNWYELLHSAQESMKNKLSNDEWIELKKELETVHPEDYFLELTMTVAGVKAS